MTTPSLWQGVLRIADPKITLASVAALVLGAAAAAHDGHEDPIAWGWLALTVLGIFFIEAAKNASGELFDFDSGTDLSIAPEDRSPFSGGKRVLVDGLLSRRQLLVVAGLFYVGGAAVGLAVVALREPLVLPLGMLGVALAFFYHAPPFKLSYRGLGEAAVALAYGPVITAGTYLVQRHTITMGVLLVSLPLALLIAAFLWVNEFPDALADESAGKRTLVVQLGRPRAARWFGVLVGAAFAILVTLPLLGPPGLPVGLLLGLAGAPLALLAARRLRAFPTTTSMIIPAQRWTLLSFLLMAAGAAAGLVLTR